MDEPRQFLNSGSRRNSVAPRHPQWCSVVNTRGPGQLSVWEGGYKKNETLSDHTKAVARYGTSRLGTAIFLIFIGLAGLHPLSSIKASQWSSPCRDWWRRSPVHRGWSPTTTGRQTSMRCETDDEAVRWCCTPSTWSSMTAKTFASCRWSSASDGSPSWSAGPSGARSSSLSIWWVTAQLSLIMSAGWGWRASSQSGRMRRIGAGYRRCGSRRRTRRARRCGGNMRRNGVSPSQRSSGTRTGSIDVMRLDQTRHVACASSCMSIRTSLEEGWSEPPLNWRKSLASENAEGYG